MNSLVSIIIPSYNRVDLIRETLDSIKQQTYTNWECLVVDDGSTDNTEELIQSYIKEDKRFKFFKRPVSKPKGANACRNFGFENSNGTYVLFIDSDDVITACCLKNRMDLFQTNKDLDFVIASTALLYKGDFSLKVLNRDPLFPSTKAYYLSFLKYELPWTSTLSVLWQREVVNSNPFDEQLLRFQDIDFHLSVLKNEYVFERLSVIDNYYRVVPNKIHNKSHILSVLDNLLLFFDKHISEILSKKENKQAFRNFIYYFLENYIFPNYHSFRREIKNLLSRIYKSGLYSQKQLFLIKAQEFLVKTKFHKMKYIGMYRLNKVIKKTLKNS
ncbi:glycosyltransferase family 2 protein [Formosa maritima]|uniref:Glycosyltransferase family 2 protein n=1 Tax=Formosa maritima TaxID=2592046 RepID=A0A5D0GG81_9FLAO|nr:glycosyltransferase family 2 protein [Formosa maritima]TYA56652.1 glycosyltransferase family 2 protein [Formosa maritima]